jgi:hypothetical protein
MTLEQGWGARSEVRIEPIAQVRSGRDALADKPVRCVEERLRFQENYRECPDKIGET